MMQKLAFTVSGDSGVAEVSVSKAGGPVLMNVNRWRGQLGMKPLKASSELDLEETSVSGQPGLLAELHGESKSSVVVMVPASAPRWFIKLNGDTEVVKQQTAAFRQYLTTIRIAEYQ